MKSRRSLSWAVDFSFVWLRTHFTYPVLFTSVSVTKSKYEIFSFSNFPKEMSVWLQAFIDGTCEGKLPIARLSKRVQRSWGNDWISLGSNAVSSEGVGEGKRRLLPSVITPLVTTAQEWSDSADPPECSCERLCRAIFNTPDWLAARRTLMTKARSTAWDTLSSTTQRDGGKTVTTASRLESDHSHTQAAKRFMRKLYTICIFKQEYAHRTVQTKLLTQERSFAGSGTACWVCWRDKRLRFSSACISSTSDSGDTW